MKKLVLMRMMMIRTISDGGGGLPPVNVPARQHRIYGWSCVEGALMGQVRGLPSTWWIFNENDT